MGKRRLQVTNWCGIRPFSSFAPRSVRISVPAEDISATFAHSGSCFRTALPPEEKHTFHRHALSIRVENKTSGSRDMPHSKALNT